MRKLNVLLLILFIYSINGVAQMKWNSAYQSYINQYKDLAIEEMLKYNIPASITLAQGVFESSAGRSSLTINGNNHFGIKCHDWLGASVYTDDDAVNDVLKDIIRAGGVVKSIFTQEPSLEDVFIKATAEVNEDDRA